MGAPYTAVDISNYNLNPPPDDGSNTPANEITWAKHKEKLSDPLKTAIESIDDNIVTAFGKVAGGVTAVADDYQVLAGDQGKLVKMSVAAKTITTPDATSVTSPFKCWVYNASSGDLTIDGSGSQTVDGAANITVPTKKGVLLETDGSNWFTGGQNWLLSGDITRLTADASPDETADYLVTYDASAATTKKVLPSDLQTKLSHIAPDVILEDQKTSGTDGGTFTSGADRTRTLNTETRDALSLCSLASNQFTLAAGTYYIEWSAPAYQVNAHQTMLYDVTGAAVLKRGRSSYTTNSGNPLGDQTISSGCHVFTIGSSNVFEIRHRCGSSTTTNGFGVAGGFGTEIFTEVKIWKIG